MYNPANHQQPNLPGLQLLLIFLGFQPSTFSQKFRHLFPSLEKDAHRLVRFYQPFGLSMNPKLSNSQIKATGCLKSRCLKSGGGRLICWVYNFMCKMFDIFRTCNKNTRTHIEIHCVLYIVGSHFVSVHIIISLYYQFRWITFNICNM